MKVYVGGELVRFEEIVERFPELQLPRGTQKIINVLMGAVKPMTRKEIVTKAILHPVYCSTLIKQLVDYGFVIRLGRMHYLLTERGFKTLGK